MSCFVQFPKARSLKLLGLLLASRPTFVWLQQRCKKMWKAFKVEHCSMCAGRCTVYGLASGRCLEQILTNQFHLTSSRLIETDIIDTFWSFWHLKSRGFAHHSNAAVASFACHFRGGRFASGTSSSTAATLRSSSGESSEGREAGGIRKFPVETVWMSWNVLNFHVFWQTKLHILSNIRRGDLNMRDLAFDDAMEDLMLLAICLLLVDCDRCLNFKDFKPLMRVVKVVIFPGLENIRARKSEGLPESWHWWRPLPWESPCLLYFWVCNSTTAFVNFISGWYGDQIELIAIPAASWQHLNQLNRGLTASKTRHYLCWLDVCSLSLVQGFGAGDSKWRFHGHGIFHWLHPFWALLQPGAGAWNHPCGYRRDHVKCSSCHCNFTVVFLA